MNMRNNFIITYAMNLSQALNMALFALGVPLIIGLKDYGIYAAIYAIPGLFQSTFECYLIVGGIGSANIAWRSRAILLLTITGGVITIISVAWLWGFSAAIAAVGMQLAIFIRSIATARLYLSTHIDLLRVGVTGELIILFGYITVLAIAQWFEFKSYLVPAAMLIAASLCAAAYIHSVLASSKPEQFTSKLASNDGMTAALFGKSYEDLFLTLPPLAIASLYGATLAGEYRFMVSLIKAASKVFPYRYELVVRAVREKTFSVDNYTLASLVFTVFGMVAFFTTKWGNIQWNFWPDTMLPMLLSTGPVVSLLPLFPAIISKTRFLLYVVIIAVGLMLGVPWALNSTALIAEGFVAMNFILYALVLGYARLTFVRSIP